MRHDLVLIYGVDGKDFIKFNFKQTEILKYEELKPKLLCRLLPPYINNVQQLYSSYIERFGLPRIPNSVLKSLK
jgi:hypothetical protein